jgi:peroxiredoxin
VAISPDRPSRLVQSRRAKGLGYALYSDSRMEAARAFGIAFQLDTEGVAKMQRFGIDLEAASGQNHHQLPVPSVFLVDADGIVRWRYSNPDHRVRPDNGSLLAAARERAGAATRPDRSAP